MEHVVKKTVLSLELENDDKTRGLEVKIGGDVPLHWIRFTVSRMETGARSYRLPPFRLTMPEFMDMGDHHEALEHQLVAELDPEFTSEALLRATELIMLWDPRYEDVGFNPEKE